MLIKRGDRQATRQRLSSVYQGLAGGGMDPPGASSAKRGWAGPDWA